MTSNLLPSPNQRVTRAAMRRNCGQLSPALALPGFELSRHSKLQSLGLQARSSSKLCLEVPPGIKLGTSCRATAVLPLLTPPPYRRPLVHLGEALLRDKGTTKCFWGPLNPIWGPLGWCLSSPPLLLRGLEGAEEVERRVAG